MDTPINPIIATHNQTRTPNDRAIADRLATVITNTLPADTENKIFYANPAWLMDGNPIVTYSRKKAGLCLMFWSGQSFDEPNLKPEGKFKAAEIIYTSVDEINEEDLIRWLHKSVETQWDYKNIVKNRGVLDRIC